MSEQESHEPINIDWRNLSSQPVHREPMDASQESAFAPFDFGGTYLAGEPAAQHKASKFELLERDLHAVRLHPQLSGDSPGRRRAADFNSAAHERHASRVDGYLTVQRLG